MGIGFSAILVALFKLFFLLVAGYFLNKRGMLGPEVNKGMTSLVVNFTNPALILGSLSATGTVLEGNVAKLLVFGIGFYILLPIMAFIIVRVLRINPMKRGTAELLLIFANTGFMAIPVLQTIYGDVAVFYINILNMPFNFLIYTYGIYLLTKNQQSSAITDTCSNPLSTSADGSAPSVTMTATQDNVLEPAIPASEVPAGTAAAALVTNAVKPVAMAPASPKLSWKVFLTPGILCSILALVMYFAHWHFPLVLSETFSFVGNVTPPLTMLLMGSILAEYPLKGMFADARINLMLVLKLLVFPVIALVLARLVFNDSVIIGIICLTFAMPCGSMCFMLSKEYHGDTATASAGVVFSTVLSLLTIPVVYLLLSRFF